MTDLLLQDDATPLLLQDAATGLELQGGGAPVKPPVERLEPGDLGRSGYPSFFPCPTWQYAQGITGHLGRTPFASGWIRQRKVWREQNTSVSLTFNMPTDMFDRWSKWMTNNGYDWFTMYLDRFSGGRALSEVRLVSPIDWRYASHDIIVATVNGELGAGVIDYGPQEGPLEGGNDYGNFCIPVYIETPLENHDNAKFGDDITFIVGIGTGATGPVEYRWYEDNIAIPGEVGPTLNYTVPTVGSILEEHQIKIAVNVANPCGEAWSTAVITIPPDMACDPYACNALALTQADIQGAGVWDLLDGNFAPQIPDYFRQSGEYTPGGRLTCTDSGSNWDSSVGVSRATQAVEDLDLCDGPWIMKNTESGAFSSFWITPRPLWGSALPNCAMAVVLKDADAHGTDPDNYLFRGAVGVQSWTQLGNPNNGTFLNEAQVFRDAGSTQDAIVFNSGNLGEHYFYYPWNHLAGNTPKLVEILIEINDVWYEASTEQSYPVASYDMMVSQTYRAWVTDPDTGVTDEQSHTVEFRILQTFDQNHDDPGLPISEEYKSTNTGSTNQCNYMGGGFGGFYNLAVRHAHGGEGAGVKFLEGGSNPGRIGTDADIHLAFLRNFDTYDTPGYCDLPQPARRTRGRT